MRAHPIQLPALLCACLALSCSTPVVSVGIRVVTAACPLAISADAQRDPTAGVDTLRFRLTGDGLSPVTVTALLNANGAAIPNVPVGTHRRITAEALVAGTGLVRSRADSGPFDVTSGSDVQLTLFLRVVDAFVFTGAKDNSACTHLITPRAGHQMTLLPDGRALITGGYSIDGTGALHFLTQAEIYDPRDGSFSAVATQENLARAGHAAFPVLVNGFEQVLLMGGEGPANGSSIGPVGPFELFGNDAFTTVSLPTTTPPRERAAMALDVKTGYAVMAGGANGPDVAGQSVSIYDNVTYYNPQQNSVVEVDEHLPAPLADAVGVSRQNKVTGGVVQGGVVLLGGRDATGNATAQISGIVYRAAYHAYEDDTTYETPALAKLPTPRVHHAAIVANDDTILVLGGSTATNDNYTLTTNAITVVDPAAVSVGNATQVLNQSRADGCAVLLQSGNILYSGGAWGDASGVHSTASVDLIAPAGQSSVVRALEGPTAGGNWNLQAARHKAACLVLADGTVLVTGGLQFQSSTGTPIALGSAEIYTPPAQ